MGGKEECHELRTGDPPRSAETSAHNPTMTMDEWKSGNNFPIFPKDRKMQRKVTGITASDTPDNLSLLEMPKNKSRWDVR